MKEDAVDISLAVAFGLLVVLVAAAFVAVLLNSTHQEAEPQPALSTLTVEDAERIFFPELPQAPEGIRKASQ